MPTLRRRVGQISLMVALVALAATIAVVVSPGGGGRTIAAVGDPLGSGGEFHPLTPARILDTRRPAPLDVAPFGPKPTGTTVTFDVPIVGKGGLNAAPGEVLAVVANVTVAVPSRPGHLTIFPKGSAPGTSSVVNFAAGQTVANSTILRPGQDGKVTLQIVTPSGAGSAHVIIDISGWFSTSSYATRGARVIPVEPTRVYDSKDTGRTLAGAVHVPLELRSRAAGLGVPGGAANVTGVIVNLTGVNAFGRSQPTHLAVVPNGFDRNNRSTYPTTSNLNLVPGQTRANLVVVPVGSDGRLHLFNLQGEVRIVVDVVGFLVTNQDVNTRRGRVIPLETSFRSLDTRREEFYDQPLGPGRAEDFSFQAFVNDVRVGTQPVGPQSGLFGNLTAVGLERQYSWGPPERSHMTVYPTPTNGSTTPPNISNLNLGEAEAVPNMALLRYGGGADDQNRIRFFNFAGYVDYILDVHAVVLADP